MGRKQTNKKKKQKEKQRQNLNWDKLTIADSHERESEQMDCKNYDEKHEHKPKLENNPVTWSPWC